MHDQSMPYDWTPFEYALSWLERTHTLLVACGGMRADDKAMLGTLTRGLLAAAAGAAAAVVITGEPGTPTPEPPAPGTPASETIDPDPAPPIRRRSRRPTSPAEQNGHTPPEPMYWSLNERLRALGYPEDLDRSTRVRLGQAVVEAYRVAHGKAPKVAQTGGGAHAKRVSLYPEADLPMVDGIIREMLGNPVAEVPVGVEA